MTSLGPIRTVVELMKPCPVCPASTTLPSSTSIHALSTFAKRMAPTAISSSTSAIRSGGGES